ncbi:DUF115 domain-containing protein [Thiomicrospira sp. R3]|uniref:6-hydroxymethylpterin diphosphokinase MptE-like protein n=1 Tax=Thiomicrospira sp. R3 TaxID=3035472 RepID=UPI00259BEA3A|nr:6-hydroxymethylpterin diphosphokinase MptE-like protein [Thiomicrospira sp. R3]WFE67935.1 DUF115 domain-containing protein [Thiomicrospira sp. R3]
MIKLEDKRVNPFGEVFYTEINQLLFANESAESIYKRHYPDLFKPTEMVYVVVGTDSGLFYRFVTHANIPEHVKFVFIDFDEVYEKTSLKSELSTSLGNTVNLVNKSFNLERLAIEYQTYFLRQKVKLIKSMAVVDSPANGEYEQFWLDFKARFDTLSNRVYIAQNTQQFENARLYNAADNLIPIKQLGEPLAGLSAVILGGGPTLDESIDWIKENQEHLVIFSVARIAQRLYDEGITPDFFVSVDPHDVSFDNSKGIFAFEEQSILLHSYHVNPKLISQWTGLKAFGGSKYGWKNELPVNIGSPGPTVVNGAFHYAVEMGCQTVYLSGVDFCFPKGQTHESSSQEAKLSAKLKLKDLITIENNAGELAETKPTLLSTKNAFVQQVHYFKSKKPSLDVVSLGYQSAKMKNVSYSPTQAIVFETTADVLQSIDFVKQQLTLSKQSLITMLKQVKVELAEQIKRFKAVSEFSTEGLKSAPKLIDLKTQQPKQKTKNKLEKLRRKINNALQDDADMLMNYNFTHFLDNFKPDQHFSEDAKFAAEQLEIFFKSVERSSKQYLQLLMLAKERTVLREDEVKGLPPSNLAPFWSKYNEPGRARFWLKYNGMADRAAESDCLDKMFKAFKREVASTETKLASKLKKSIQSLSLLLDQAKQALKEGKVDKLADIEQVAHQLPLDTEKEAIIQLIEAMRAEMSGDLEQALGQYVLIEEPACRQIGLQCASNLAINQQRYQDAMVILEELCRFSYDYMLPYADLVDLLGQTAFAADIIKLYIAQKPEAYLANLKLANLLVKLGQLNQARLALEQVLVVDPDNLTARHQLSHLKLSSPT